MKHNTIKRDNLNMMRPTASADETAAKKFVEELLSANIIASEDWHALTTQNRSELERHGNLDRLLMRLVDYKLITQYQSARLQNKLLAGLVLGEYRLRERIGGGDAGVIFKAEQIHTREMVALKVLIPSRGQDSPLLRFDAERRAISEVRHPHIVRVMNMGEASVADPDAPLLYFYAMEYIPGLDLEARVKQQGVLSIKDTCTIAYQIADALTCVHEHGLVHRDVKPANILWTDDGQAKLLDFGVAMVQQNRQTQAGTILGMLEYIAPEQARESRDVDIRADIFALGSTLYFCLTGEPPFKPTGDLLQAVLRKLREPPAAVRTLRKDCPPELDSLIARMMAPNADDRFATPAELLKALAPLVDADANELPQTTAVKSGPTMLIVAQDAELRRFVNESVAPLNGRCDSLDDEAACVAALSGSKYDVVLLAPSSFGSSLALLLTTIRDVTKEAGTLILLTGDANKLANAGCAGADDIVPLPLQPNQFLIRVRAVLQLKNAQRRATESKQLSDVAAVVERPADHLVAPAGAVRRKSGWFERLFAPTAKLP